MSARKITLGKPKPERFGLCVVWKFESQTRAGMSHYTFYSKADTTLFCSCEGFQAHDHCWHADKIQELLSAPK